MPKRQPRDPSTALSTRLQKWLVFSIGLALIGVGADTIGVLLARDKLTMSNILGDGELYLVAVGMLFSAAGELLYDRTRLETAGAWQITLAVATMMFAIVPGALLTMARGRISTPGEVALWSTTFACSSCGWGIVLILLTKSGE